MAKTFDIGDLVRYDAIIPSYLPGLVNGLGIVLQTGAADVVVWSMTSRQMVVVRGSSCIVLSPADPKKW